MKKIKKQHTSTSKSIKIRTSMFTREQRQLLCTMLFLFYCFQFVIVPSWAIKNSNFLIVQKNLAIADRFENLTVENVPENPTIDSRLILKIHGLPSAILANDSDNAIKLKPTFSLDYCDINASDFDIIVKKSNELIIMLSNFNFNEHTTAYLCLLQNNALNSITHIDNDVDDGGKFEHMGIRSAFQRYIYTFYNLIIKNTNFVVHFLFISLQIM